MKTLHKVLATILLVVSVQTVSFAQTTNVSETFKKHFNETVQDVQSTEDVDLKRAILNESFSKMILTIDRIDAFAPITEDKRAMLISYKGALADKLNELNGLDGFDKVLDKDLDEFSSYSQNFIEQANKTITIGVTTALLILIILLLL